MTDLDRIVAECEKSAELFARFRRQQAVGSDLHLMADDAVEAIYALLDTIAARMPSPQADLT
jgi:RNA binding exosome subunit